AFPDGGAVVAGNGVARRVGTMWIGWPPLSHAQVGTAVCPGAGRGPILCAPVTVGGRRCEERHGDHLLRRRGPTRLANGPGRALVPTNQERPERSCQVVISAQTKPASSRATAVATTVRRSLRAANRRNRPHRRTWAAHDRSGTWGARPSWRRWSSAP